MRALSACFLGAFLFLVPAKGRAVSPEQLAARAAGVKAEEIQADEWPFKRLTPGLQAAARQAVVEADRARRRPRPE